MYTSSHVITLFMEIILVVLFICILGIMLISVGADFCGIEILLVINTFHIYSWNNAHLHRQQCLAN